MNLRTKSKKVTPEKLSQIAAAPMLGVSREHLNRVINGRRQSRRLLAAWQALTHNPIMRPTP